MALFSSFRTSLILVRDGFESLEAEESWRCLPFGPRSLPFGPRHQYILGVVSLANPFLYVL